MRSFCTYALLVTLAPLLRAGSVGGDSYHLENAADREVTRREENLIIAEQELRAGEAALQRDQIAEAYEHFKSAADLVPQGSAGGSLRSRVMASYSSSSVRYAEYLVSRGDYSEARRIANELLEPRYNPNYRPAIVFLSRLEEADYFNKTVTPEFAAQRDEVGKLMNEAVGFYDSGRYDMAQKRYRQVLAIDKDNAAAFRGLEQVELGKQRYYDSAYSETRSRMLWQVERAWQRPHNLPEKANVLDEPLAATRRAGTEKTVALLNQLIVPKIQLKKATIQQAVAVLREESRRLSSAEDGTGQAGVNIVLKLPSPSVQSDGTALPSPADTSITLKLDNVPLYEALRYVARLAGLNIKVEPFAVTLGTDSESMERKVFRVPPGFFAGASRGEPAVEESYAGRPEPLENKLTARGGVNAKQFLVDKGISFESGSSASYSVDGGTLQVVNTPSNLDYIQSLLEAAAAEEPRQIKIQTKFVEISQNNLKELGFDWMLGPFSIGGSGVYGGGGNPAASGREFPFVNPATGAPIGTDTLTGGLRTGRGTAPYSALSVNSINALIAQNLGITAQSAAGPGVFSIAGIFTNPQFQMVIRALNQKKGIDLMAAPSVTTQSGKQATITLSRIFYYPTEFEPPQIPQSTGGGAQNINGLVQEQDPVVTPSFPTSFEKRDIGVTLTVDPTIGPDGYTIDMSLAPEVIDFDGFINYGSPIYAPQRTGVVVLSNAIVFPNLFRQQLLTQNVINQPIFSKRKVETSVTVYDSQTVVLGGLIREDVQKVTDKVPVLGDIPLAGALFRSQVEQKIKRNLVIFCTPQIVDASGLPITPEQDYDDEEDVAPLGLPQEVKPQRANPKGGLTRK